MKKGYHDYVPLIKDVKKEEKVEEPQDLSKERYITTTAGVKYMVTDAKGMVVAGTDVLQFGHKFPGIYNTTTAKSPFRMSTKDYLKYNGRL